MRVRGVAWALVLGLLAAPVVPGWSAPAAASVGAMVHGVRVNQRVVALSFDDGPNPAYTPRVLALLAAHGDHATFFLEGQFVSRWPGLARSVVDAGDEVGNHTYDHPDVRSLPESGLRAQLTRTSAAFAAAGLPAPSMFRPPKGLFDGRAAAVVRSTGLRPVGWTRGLCVEHWVRRSGSPGRAGVDAMLAQVRPGSILLAHDGGIPARAATMAALPALLDGLAARGYRVVTVGELLSLGARGR